MGDLLDDDVWGEFDTRPAVKGRSYGVCEYCQSERASEMHHRKSRGTGGRWEPSNILHLCGACHRWVTNHPTLSYALGLSLKRGMDAETTPVIHCDGTWFQPTNEILKGVADW
jgi:5-methylcytosine-specific restriction endonuclease McrA